MATKKQGANWHGKKIWIDKVGSTADRSTECDDLRIDDHSWKWSKAYLGNNCPRIRKDAIA